MKPLQALVGILVLFISSSAFALTPKGLCSDLPAAKKGDLAAAEKAAAAAWSKRESTAQLKAAVKGWAEATAINPKKSENWMKLGRAQYLLADGHMRFDDDLEDEMVNVFANSVFSFERVLKLTNAEYTFAVCAKEPMKKVVKTIGKPHVAAVYWYAVALGKYGLASSITEVLGNKDRIVAFIKRVGKLDRNFNYGGPDRYLGAYYTKIPIPKGDKARSKKHFESSIKRAPNYLATRVLMAQMLVPKFKDRALFKSLLDFVINAKADIIPELTAEHKIEKKKAKLLLEDIDHLFPKDGEG